MDPDGHASEALQGPEACPVLFPCYCHPPGEKVNWPFAPKPERQESKVDGSSHSSSS